MKKFAFLAGLPRTGSTLLGTLLAQHPDIYSTRTSVVREIMNYALRFNLGESPYFDQKDPNSPVWGILRGVLGGAYEGVDKPLILEKNRGWSESIDLLRDVLGCEPKILAPVRDIPEIIASFILISRKVGPNSKIEDELALLGRESNSWTLSRVIWEKYVYANWKVFKTGYEHSPENFHLVDYNRLVTEPQKVLREVYSFLDLSYQEPETDNLTNSNPENDAVYGLPGLHYIRPQLQRTSPSAEEVLGQDCYEFWQSKNLEFWRGKIQ